MVELVDGLVLATTTSGSPGYAPTVSFPLRLIGISRISLQGCFLVVEKLLLPVAPHAIGDCRRNQSPSLLVVLLISIADYILLFGKCLLRGGTDKI